MDSLPTELGQRELEYRQYGKENSRTKLHQLIDLTEMFVVKKSCCSIDASTRVE